MEEQSKSWQDLIHEDDALPLVRGWAEAAPHAVDILPSEPVDGQRALQALQVTTRSPLGAIAFHTGGILVDGGWLRILGAGTPLLPRALDQWNGMHSMAAKRRFDDGLLVGDDAAGGFFNWARDTSTVHYFGPDSMEWDDLELGYSEWIRAMFSNGLAAFYEDLRWDGWREEVAALGPEQGIHIYPPPVFASEGPRSHKAVSMDELWNHYTELGRELAGIPEGTAIRIENS